MVAMAFCRVYITLSGLAGRASSHFLHTLSHELLHKLPHPSLSTECAVPGLLALSSAAFYRCGHSCPTNTQVLSATHARAGGSWCCPGSPLPQENPVCTEICCFTADLYGSGAPPLFKLDFWWQLRMLTF